MTKANNLIKISGLTYIMFSLFIIPYVPFFAGILLVIGIILLSNSFLSLEELSEKKAVLVIVAIVSIFLNLLAAILIFVSFEDISSAKKDSTNSPPKEIISSESKKIDLLLKVGLAMVLIAGILFATTTWKFITDPIKVVALILMGILFLGLSIFSENVLKIEKTTKGYFVLGLAFLVITFIGIGYFAPFGASFSYSGSSSALIYAITFFLTAGAFYLVNYRFKDQECLYLAHSSIYLGIFSLLSFFNLPVMAVLLIMVSLTFILNIFSKEETTSIQKFNAIVSFLYYPLIITQSTESIFPFLLITSIINIMDMLIQVAKESTPSESIFASILSYILIFVTLGNIPYDIDAMLTIFITMTIYSMLVKYSPLAKNNSLTITNQIIYHLASFVIIFYYILSPSIESIIVTLVYLIINILGSLKITRSNTEVDFRYQPVVIFYFITTIAGYIYENFFELDLVLIPIACSLVYALIDYFTKKHKVKKYYFGFAIGATIFAFISNIGYLNIFASIILLLLSIYIYIRSNKDCQVWAYVFILCNIQELSVALLPSMYANILSLLIFALLTLVIKDKRLNIVNYMSFTVPLIGLITNISYEFAVYKMIATSFLELYVIFLITKFLIKDDNTKEVFSTIFYCLITSRLLVEKSIEVGIYIGVVALLIIFAVFNNDNYKKLFYSSIVVIILNIVIQLWDFWGMIPFWLYLLIVGLSIIIFVTYKELNKSKHPTPVIKQVPISEAKEIPVVEDTFINKENTLEESQVSQEIAQITTKNEPTTDKYCPTCGTKNIGNSNFCRSCGHKFTLVQEEVTVSKFCATCGTPNTSNGNFCKTCGHNLVIKK